MQLNSLKLFDLILLRTTCKKHIFVNFATVYERKEEEDDVIDIFQMC